MSVVGEKAEITAAAADGPAADAAEYMEDWVRRQRRAPVLLLGLSRLRQCLVEKV